VAQQLELQKHPYFNPKAGDTPAAASKTTDLQQVDPRVEDMVLRRFRGNLSVTKVPRTRVVEIGFLSPDPQLSVKVVNALVSDFIEQNFRTKYESTMQTSNWLSQQLLDLQAKVETSQEKLVRYQKEAEILGIDEKQNITTAKLNELNEQLTKAQASRIEKQALYELTLKGDPELIPGVSENKIIQKLKDQQAEVRNEYAQAETQFGSSHPKIVQLKTQLLQIEGAIETEVRKLARRMENEYSGAKLREALLAQALEQQKGEANRLNERAIQYNLLKREMETNRELYEGLLQRLKEAGIASGLRSASIRVVDTPRLPLRPSKPNIFFNLMVALMVSTVGGLALALALEQMDTSIRDPQEAASVAGLPSLGVVPLDREAPAGLRVRRHLMGKAGNGQPAEDLVHLVTLARPMSDVSESYRALRTSLLLSSPGGPPRMILVTSGLPQEGKTTTSVNTAVVLAQRGARVLLVDADLRRPGVHRFLGLQPHSGLSQLLARDGNLGEIVASPTSVPGLSVILAGPPPPYPAELLGSAAMKRLLAQWRAEFDHVVVDTPPVLTVTDAVVLSQDMDAVMIVIRAGQTTKQALRRTRDVLRQVNARLTGVVVNALDFRAHSYYYYGPYYGYGSKGGAYGYHSDESKET
jgi:capsular exopolysaccharide synthesis family protein